MPSEIVFQCSYIVFQCIEIVFQCSEIVCKCSEIVFQCSYIVFQGIAIWGNLETEKLFWGNVIWEVDFLERKTVFLMHVTLDRQTYVSIFKSTTVE